MSAKAGTNANAGTDASAKMNPNVSMKTSAAITANANRNVSRRTSPNGNANMNTNVNTSADAKTSTNRRRRAHARGIADAVYDARRRTGLLDGYEECLKRPQSWHLLRSIERIGEILGAGRERTAAAAELASGAAIRGGRLMPALEPRATVLAMAALSAVGGLEFTPTERARLRAAGVLREGRALFVEKKARELAGRLALEYARGALVRRAHYASCDGKLFRNNDLTI
ncbi:MAG: hypothetical protein QXG08_06270 [Candidatus Methanomethyliaceae archaeon]